VRADEELDAIQQRLDELAKPGDPIMAIAKEGLEIIL